MTYIIKYYKPTLEVTPVIAMLLLQFAAISARAETFTLDQPPVSCPEEMLPRLGAEKKASLQREIDAGAAGAKMAYLDLFGETGRDEKLRDLAAAADAYDLPPQVLAGAIKQESDFAEIGITKDFGNWACGLGQLNLNEYCEWAQSLPVAEQRALGWPVAEIESFMRANPDRDPCETDFIAREHVQPLQAIALRRMNAGGPERPEYMLRAQHMTSPTRITYAEVQAAMQRITAKWSSPSVSEDDRIEAPEAPVQSARLRFLIARAFAETCSIAANGIRAKAFTLAQIQDTLPEDARQAQRYLPGAAYRRSCESSPRSRSYPLGVSWLLAVAVYNAGDGLLPGIEEYRKAHSISWDTFSPAELAQAIDWAVANRPGDLPQIARLEAVHHIRNLVGFATLPGESIIP